MVASLDRRVPSFQGHTEELVNLISKFRSKKMFLKKRQKRDLRVEAILSSVLTRAQQELRAKQQQRLRKWLEVKSELCLPDSRCDPDVWKEKDLGLDSLHNFMLQLQEVKTCVQR